MVKSFVVKLKRELVLSHLISICQNETLYTISDYSENWRDEDYLKIVISDAALVKQNKTAKGAVIGTLRLLPTPDGTNIMFVDKDAIWHEDLPSSSKILFPKFIKLAKEYFRDLDLLLDPSHKFKGYLTNPIILTGILAFLGVLITAILGYVNTNRPISATETAEAKRTSEALLMANPSSTVTSAPIPTTTIILANTTTSTPELTITPNVTRTQELTSTPSITSSPTPFYNEKLRDDFIDNSNGWFVQREFGSGGPSITRKIIGGKYEHTLSCPLNYQSPFCGVYTLVPFEIGKDFYIQFDTTLIDAPTEKSWMVGIQYRRNGGRYYISYFKGWGNIESQIEMDKEAAELVNSIEIPQMRKDVGETNTLGILAKGPKFFQFVNGEQISSFEDGNISLPGNVYIVFFVYRGATVTIKIDNFIYGPPIP